MSGISPISDRVKEKLAKHGLSQKFAKKIQLLTSNSKHPSLHVETLEPKSRGIFSFRIDRQYRVIFIFRSDTKTIEIIMITNHYH